MTDILVRWLNDEVKLSKKIDQNAFAKEFATGYLLGEVLHLYQMQDDFDQFSQSKTADSKLNNFTRLEPKLHLLGVPFDTNVARGIMTEEQGVATTLLYQMFIAINKKIKANLTSTAMETMRPAAPVKLEGIESYIYRERLKRLTPRQTDDNLKSLIGRFHEKQVQMESIAFKQRFEEQERLREEKQAQRQALIDRSRQARARQTEVMAKIQAAQVHIPKPPPSHTIKAMAARKEARQRLEAEQTRLALEKFEERMKTILPPSKPFGVEEEEDDGVLEEEEEEKEALPMNPLDLIKPSSNDDYIGKIRKRLNEDAAARAEREKRRRKVLVDQMKAHEAQEEARREEMLVNRLMRQSQQERRIAVQLLQARQEKEVIRRNRLLREKQYEERRLKDFEEALNRESEMARLAKLEYLEQTKMDRELHDQIAAQRAEARYRRHYDMCGDILTQILDFTTKIGEYRELTNRLLPPKLMREWTDLFLAGKPLYDEPLVISETEVTEEGLTPAQVLEKERQELLNEGDFMEYKNMIGEWLPPEGCEVTGPPRSNPIVGHIVQRLLNIVHPPSPPPAPPEFPPFPIKACVLGKVFSGKTSCVERLAEAHRLQVLSADVLVNEAIEAFNNGELAPEESELDVKPSEEATVLKVADTSATSVTPEIVVSQTVADGNNNKESASQENKVDDNKMADNKTVEEIDNTEKKDVGNEKGPSQQDLLPRSKSDVAPGSRGSVASSKKSSKNEGTPEPQLSARAKLGSKATKLLKKGKPVDDQIVIDIMVEAIRCLPEGTGWVMDGYPTTYAQAKMLEKALSGLDLERQEAVKAPRDSKGRMRKSQLAPDPRPSSEKVENKSGIDVVILFDIPDEICLKRSAGRTKQVQADQEYQQEFNPPPDGAATGVNKVEKVVAVEDPAHDMEQAQHRVTGFLDAWPKLEKWFTRFGTLQKVDASLPPETVYLETEKVLEDTLQRLKGPPVEESITIETEPEKPPEPPVIEEPPPPPELPKEEDKPSTPKKRSRSGSGKSRSSSKGSGRGKSPKGKERGKSPKGGDKSPSPKKDSKKGTPKSSRANSPKRGRSRSGKKSKTPEPEPEPEPEPPGTPPPAPGSELWEYVDEPIDPELAEILAPHWEAVENTYVDSSKDIFSNVREERENIIRYFFKIRKDYLAYLRRPDTKQEFVSQWQKSYNEIADDMREDAETQSELHQRIDDLRERLWTVCDDRKEQAEKERSDIMNDGWLEDRMGVLSNHYITLMQAETDRFQDTVRLLKDYYKGMEGHIPDELVEDYARIALIDLPPTERPGSPAKSVASESTSTIQQKEEPLTPVPPKEVKSKSSTPSGKRKRKGSGKKDSDSAPPTPPPAPADGEEEKKKIPLVPRRPGSADMTTQAAPPPGGKDKKADKKGDKKKGAPPPQEEKVESPLPPMDPDDKLLHDAYVSGCNFCANIIATEQAAREAEEEAEREKELARERERENAANKGKGKKGKGGKSRSPSPKKGKDKKAAPEPTPPPPGRKKRRGKSKQRKASIHVVEEETEEEKAKKAIKNKMREEYFAAIMEEESSCKVRLELIKVHAMGVLADLKGKSEEAYKDMNDWLGARFLKEMESIDYMSEVMRDSVERREKISEELTLQQEDFLVSQDVKAVKTPSPIPRPDPVEQPQPDQFTVEQLNQLHAQFTLCAPTGVMSTKAFIDTFQEFTSLTHGMELLPDLWMNVSSQQLQEIVSVLSPDSEYINWRSFVLAASQPWPIPTQRELLETLDKFKDMDQKCVGYVTREQYDSLDLWFRPERPETPEDPSVPYPYNRIENLKKTFFDIFADNTTDFPRLDYKSMLLYFAVSPDSEEGFLRALSVASEQHMPHDVENFFTVKEEPSVMVDDPASIPEDSRNAPVSIEALYKVLHHGESSRGDSHRFSVTSDPENAMSMERLMGVYSELGQEDGESVPFPVLMEHPVIQDLVVSCQNYKQLDLKAILTTSVPLETLETQSTKTTD